MQTTDTTPLTRVLGACRTALLAGFIAACATLGGSTPAIAGGQAPGVAAAPLTLVRLVDPASRVEINGRLVPFALHGVVRFETLAELFAYID